MFFLLSLIGFISVIRFFDLLEKFFLINSTQKRKLVVIFLIPIYFFTIIKDQKACFIIYIGGFLLSLTFFFIFFQKRIENAYFKLHLHVINMIILQVKAGYSVKKAVDDLFFEFNRLEKIAFHPLKHDFKQNFDAQARSNRFMKEYFDEITQIFKSQTKIIDQLETLKRGLMIKNRLHVKTKTILDQIWVQFVVCSIIYALLFSVSLSFFKLAQYPRVMLVSILLFACSGFLIYKLGKRVKWST